MRQVGTVKLSVAAGDVADVVATASGAVFVADSRRNTIVEFSQDGSVIRRFGARGRKPGQFTVPWRVTIDSSGSVYVLDIKQSRVHVFSATGEFTRALSFGASGVTGQDVLVDDAGSVYLGGYRHSTPSDKLRPIVHRLADDGSVVRSFYPLDPRTDALNLRPIAGVSLAHGPGGTLYAAQVTGDEALQFDANGQMIDRIGGHSAIYRPPAVLPALTSKAPVETTRAFLAQWTQLVTVLPGPHSEVMLVFAVHNPVKYAANVYRDGTLVAEGIGTDDRPIAWMRDGRVVMSDTRGPQLALHTYLWPGKQ